MKPQLPLNCLLTLVEDRIAYIRRVSVDAPSAGYDVIVVDGIASKGARLECVEAAIPFLSQRGILILDNSDLLPVSCETARAAGLIQVDFNGLVPQAPTAGRTTVFLTREMSIPYKNAATIGGAGENWEAPSEIGDRANGITAASQPLGKTPH